MSEKLKLGKVARLAAPLGLVAGMALLPQQSYAELGYTTDAEKTVVRSGAGECWKSAGGTRVKLPECGDVVEAAPAPMAAAPMDSDGDGVPDDQDQCPGTPAGVRVDATGCPLDTDGDGVPDYMDKCPGTRAGAKVDADGCEIIASMTINLDVEEFDFDSARLKPEMKAALDDVAERVKASAGNESLLIVGHTDSTGPAEYNMGLSERRAQSAADYLISDGVDADRITTKGEGESSPIADNSTREGRSRNRRVEIRTH